MFRMRLGIFKTNSNTDVFITITLCVKRIYSEQSRFGAQLSRYKVGV